MTYLNMCVTFLSLNCSTAQEKQVICIVLYDKTKMAIIFLFFVVMRLESCILIG